MNSFVTEEDGISKMTKDKDYCAICRAKLGKVLKTFSRYFLQGKETDIGLFFIKALFTKLMSSERELFRNSKQKNV